MRRSLFFIALAFATAAIAAERNDAIVSTAWLQQHLRDTNLTIVHVGDRDGYVAEHIAGALQLAVTDVVVTRNGIPNELPAPAALQATLRNAGIPNDGRIVLYADEVVAAARVFYCRTGTQACVNYFILRALGRDVRLYDGSYIEWSNATMEVAGLH